MTIRSASPKDSANIATLIQSLAHFYLDNPEGELPVWLTNTLTEQAFESRITEGEYVNFVYETDGKIVGYISLKKPNHLYHLFVDPSLHGKGIARKLWEHLKNHAQQQRYTLRSSMFAVPVYEQFGFKVSEPYGTKDGISFQPMSLDL